MQDALQGRLREWVKTVTGGERETGACAWVSGIGMVTVDSDGKRACLEEEENLFQNC